MPDFPGHGPNHSMFGGIHLEEVKANKAPLCTSDQGILKGTFEMNAVSNEVLFEQVWLEVRAI